MGYTEKEALKMLDRAAAVAAKRRDAKAIDFCKSYRQIKPALPAILWLLRLIPLYGVKIATVFELVIQVADKACIPS